MLEHDDERHLVARRQQARSVAVRPVLREVEMRGRERELQRARPARHGKVTACQSRSSSVSTNGAAATAPAQEASSAHARVASTATASTRSRLIPSPARVPSTAVEHSSSVVLVHTMPNNTVRT
jgi:hypothetical protein